MARSLSHESYGRPHVTLCAAMSVDGKIATRSGDSRISSKRDLKQLHGLRSLTDAIMIGIGTELNDNPLLTVRFAKGRNPFRIVVDSLARTPPDAKIISGKGGGVIIAVSKRATKSRIMRLERAGARVICCGSRRVDLKALLNKLYRMGIKRILLEGGGTLNWSMLANGLVDELRVTVAPLVIGGERAKTLVEGIGVRTISHAIGLSLANISRIENELVLNYKVRG